MKLSFMAFKRFVVFSSWLVLSSLCHCVAMAEESVTASGLRLNGFGTLGLTKYSSDFGGSFRRDVSQPLNQEGIRGNLDSRFGVQVNYAVNDRLELVAQAVLRQRPSPSQLQDSVEWAFAAYQLTPQIQVRGGRTGMDLFLQSDYRSVGFAYVAARPNIDFYSMLPLTGLDGMDLTHRWTGEDIEWRLKGFAGKSSYSVAASGLSTQKGELSSVMGLVLSRESHSLLLRGTLAQAKLDFKSIDAMQLQQGLSSLSSMPLPVVAAQAKDLNDQLRFRDIHVTYGSLGLAYDKNNWIFTSEVVRTRSNAPIASVRAGYAMLGRRIGRVTLYSSISGVRSELNPVVDPQWGQALAQLVSVIGAGTVAQAQLAGTMASGLINSGRIQQRTFSLGFRWDLDPRIALKLQWDRVCVSPHGGAIWVGDSNGGRAQVGTVMVDFLF